MKNALKLKARDKIVISEEKGIYYFENSGMLVFKRAEEAFAGEGRFPKRGRNAGVYEGNSKRSKGVLTYS